MNPRDLIQGSPEWKAYKAGRISGSRIAAASAKSRDGKSYGATRASLMGQIITERLTGVSTEGYTSAAMQRGTELEPAARAEYAAFHTSAEIVTVGFIDHPQIAWAGCSPDGEVGKDGLIEIKSPEPHTHINTLLTEKIDGGYIKQMQWCLGTTGRKWCDFISYCDLLPGEMQLFVKRVHRDPIMIAELEREARLFLQEVDETISQLTAKFGAMEAA